MHLRTEMKEETETVKDRKRTIGEECNVLKTRRSNPERQIPWGQRQPVSMKPVVPANLPGYSPWWASAGREEGEGGRREECGDGEGRSAHSSLGCNWISAARAEKDVQPSLSLQGSVGSLRLPNLPDTFKVSPANGLLLHGFLCSPSLICMSELCRYVMLLR